MQKIFYAAALLGAVLLATSCNLPEDTPPVESNTPAVFFPLADFIDEEVQRLDSLEVRMTKTIRYNDSLETKTQQTVDFTDELSIFRRADINKPAWTDQYQADTVFQNAQAREVRYQALEPDLEVRLLLVKWDEQGRVTEVQVRRENKSALATSEYDLSYLPARGYRIETSQENLAAGSTQIIIEGTFEE